MYKIRYFGQWRKGLIGVFLLVALVFAQTGPVEGLRTFQPRSYAFTNGHIHTSPGNMIENGTVLIKDGLIIEVGNRVKIPENFTVIDLNGKHLYAGFIDGYLPIKFNPHTNGQRENWNLQVQSGEYAIDHYSPDRDELDPRLAQGFTTAQIILDNCIFAGQTAIIQLNDEGSVISGSVANAMAFRFSNLDNQSYPNALLGSIALMRQTFMDASWYADAQEKLNKYPNLNETIDFDRHLETLSKSMNARKPFLFQVSDNEYSMRAIKLSNEFGLNLQLLGNGYEYRNLSELRAGNAFIYIPVNYPGKPSVSDPYHALEYSTAALKHWDIAPDNAQRMDNAGLNFAFTTSGLKNKNDFRPNLLRSVERGLSPITALAALTTNPASAMGLEKVLGKINEGYIANLVITDGEYFTKDAKVYQTWIGGIKSWENHEGKIDLSGKYGVTYGEKTAALTLKQSGKSFSGSFTMDTTEIKIENPILDQNRISFNLNIDEKQGKTRFRAVFLNEKLEGTIVDPWGSEMSWAATRLESNKPEENDDNDIETASELAVTFPEGAMGLSGEPAQPNRILIDNATIWTSGPQGNLEGWDILIEKGKIARISKDISLSVRPDVVINGEGKHVTPGMIDAHSHMAAASINEGSQSITSEVRIQDVLQSDDMTIYRQIGGGTTLANILHGSANTIGGQNAVIKLRWGASTSDLLMKRAPQGIKFALGENVKQSNWGDANTTRYPQTRMGVEQILRDAFTRATDYRKNHSEYERNSKWRKTLIAPRMDLELEALVEIMEGKRFVHCHSYRQDEILMLTRVAEDFGWRVRTFQHILEGYKVADRLADHGAGGSSFSDWWAYKFEVYDAIPYNVALMHDVSVLVTFNSDDDELGRRMNLEAAKGVKYGGMSEIEALKTVTINAALQLGVDKWTGSLEIGKDADFVVWSGNPLSSYSICEETWIDGKQYFSLEKDRILREDNDQVRNELIQKILKTKKNIGEPMKPDHDHHKHYSCRDHFSVSHMEGGAK